MPSAFCSTEFLGTNEVVLVPADDPAQVGLEHRGCFVDIVAVQAHRGFEAQRVASAESAQRQAERLAGLYQGQPHLVGRLRRHEDLEAVLTGIAGTRHGGAHASHLAVREPVVLHRGEIDAGERLQDVERPRTLHGDQRIASAGIDRHRIASRLDALADLCEVAVDVATRSPRA